MQTTVSKKKFAGSTQTEENGNDHFDHTFCAPECKMFHDKYLRLKKRCQSPIFYSYIYKEKKVILPNKNTTTSNHGTHISNKNDV